MNIARTTLSSKLLTHHKDHFAQLAVDAVLRLRGSGNLEAIKIIKKLGGGMKDSYLEEGCFSGWSRDILCHTRKRTNLPTKDDQKAPLYMHSV